jgi:phosphohistidine swiveling domain-containing protein
MLLMGSPKGTTYTKVFTREFTLPWLQIWYHGEAKTPKPWNNKLNQSFPYIVFVRHNDTIASYYDLHGLDWSRKIVLDQIRKDAKFIEKIKSNVTLNLTKILVQLKKKTFINKDELLFFLEMFQQAYPWFLAMWEIGESDPEKIGNLNVSSILKLKEQNNTLCDDMDNLIRESLKKIYPKIADFSDVLSIKEIQKDTLPDLKDLKQRAKGFIFTDGILYKPEEIEFVEKKYNLKLEHPKISENLTSFTGRSASNGIAKGIVRKVFALKHLQDFKPGEILVSPMTMPDFVLAMKKAAAIITDEGGITCHAAIISRELNIPCIVGTQIATEVLQNGDFVEVNANTGSVTILKR